MSKRTGVWVRCYGKSPSSPLDQDQIKTEQMVGLMVILHRTPIGVPYI